MLAGASGISVTDTININLLQRTQEELVGLPKKPKTQYAIVEAESYLHRWVHSTLRKNYTVAEIDGVFLNAGWSEEQRETFWKFFELKENKRGNKRISPIKMTRKTKKVISHDGASQNNSMSLSDPGDTVENPSKEASLSEQSITETKQILSGGHFELPPDTDDI